MSYKQNVKLQNNNDFNNKRPTKLVVKLESLKKEQLNEK